MGKGSMFKSQDIEPPQYDVLNNSVSGSDLARSVSDGHPASDLELQLVTDSAGFEALESEWNSLFDRAGQSHQLFQSYNWNWHWCQTYLNDETKQKFLELSIVVGYAEGRVVMIWPLISDRTMGLKYICWMGMPVSQYSDVLIEDGPNRMAWLDEGWRFIRAQLGADTICLPKVREDSVLAGLMRSLGQQPVQNAEALHADLAAAGNYEAYAARFSARRNKNRRRQHRRLSELGSVSFDVLTEDKAACAAVKQAIKMKRCWLLDKGLMSKAFSDERIDNFFAGMLTSPDKPTGCQVSVMNVGAETAAVVISFVCKGRHAAHISSYSHDPQFIRSGAGALLMDEVVRGCFEKGLDNFDLMAPGDCYKREWADQSVKVCDYTAPLTPLGQAHAAYGACAYTAKAIFETAPQRLRRVLISLAGPWNKP